MPKPPFSVTASALAALALVAGCQYKPGAAETDPLDVANYPQITVSGSMVGQTFLAQPPIVSRGEARPLSVAVPLRLKQREDLAVQYRFLFFDAAGRPLDINPGWKATVIRGREKTFMEGNALETAAADWQLEVREARH